MENTNPQRSKSTVFISYAREDSEFMRTLRASLEERGVEPKGDWQLTTGEDFASRLREFNLSAHAPRKHLLEQRRQGSRAGPTYLGRAPIHARGRSLLASRRRSIFA